MLPLLKTVRTLMGYLLVATLLVSPIGVFYILCGIGCLLRNRYCFNVWFALDVLACSTIHGTRRRTISGYAGERVHTKRYALLASFIDKLAVLCGDEVNHCLRAYEWERRTLNL